MPDRGMLTPHPSPRLSGSETGQRMVHIALAPDRALCGNERNPDIPIHQGDLGEIECVVCVAMWGKLSKGEKRALLQGLGLA